MFRTALIRPLFFTLIATPAALARRQIATRERRRHMLRRTVVISVCITLLALALPALGDGASDAGKDTATGIRKAGQEIKEGGKTVGREFKEFGKDVWQGMKSFGKGFKDGWKGEGNDAKPATSSKGPPEISEDELP